MDQTTPTTDEITSCLREHYPYLATEFGVKRIGLFGSMARGTADASSDIDLVVEFEHPIGFKFIELVEYLEKILGRKVDVLTPAALATIRVEEVAERIRASLIYV